MLIFQGLRKPKAQISGRTPGMFTNGLSGGMRYALPGSGWSTSMRRTLESRSEQSWPVIMMSGGDGPAPSPVEI